ncbi:MULTISPECIES: hypothetical protein [Streptomyces]|uniref:Secreted protein n=1 Tax=Streptomyces eurythermus TaxID=42237 RepID=A0ABW6Z063_9ACTN|nr:MULTISPECIES: hypothetical protein [Streptomyces]QIS69669.1 hypothetical protein HB370_06440 [Streptomyces sp. DSM 40868]
MQRDAIPVLVGIIVEGILGHGLCRLGPVADDQQRQVLAVGTGHRQRSGADVGGQVGERAGHLKPERLILPLGAARQPHEDDVLGVLVVRHQRDVRASVHSSAWW